ncbi:MAG: T9SS type A sorting domain-containing protein [Ignavibacteriaceae bacterium]
MKKIILLLSLLLVSSLVNAQVLENFNTAGSLGMYQYNNWGNPGLIDSVYQTADPVKASNGVLAVKLKLNGIGDNDAVGFLESSKGHVSSNGAQVLTLWVFVPSDVPDSVDLQLYYQPVANGAWTWTATDYYAKDIPRNKWYPLSMYIKQLSISDPSGHALSGTNDIGDFGVQFANFSAPDTTWTGEIYIDNVTLIGAKPDVYAGFDSGLEGFTEMWNNGWVDSVRWNAGPLGSKTGLIDFKLINGSAATGGTAVGIQPSTSYDAKNKNFLVFWVYAGSSLPDTAFIQVYAQDNNSWQDPETVTSYYGADIPKDVWYPLYFDMSRASVADTTAGNSFNSLKYPLGKFLLQYTGGNWDGSIYIDRVEFINSVVSAPAPPAVVWVAADFQILNNGLQGFYVPSYCDGKISRALDVSTTNKTYVLKGNADFSLSQHKFGIVRDSIPLLDTNGVDYADTALFDIYLPANMPADSGGIVQFVISGEATNNTWTQFDFNIDNHAMKAGKWNILVMDLYSLVNSGTVDPSKPAQFVVQIYYPNNVTWKGSVLFDSLAFTGIKRNGQLPPAPLVGVENNDNAVVKEFRLYNNYPNPFNPTTNIKYDLPKETFVTIRVYDILGREVATLVNEKQSSGRYIIKFDASDFASGMYICRIKAGSFIKSHKMMLLK